MPKDLIHFTIAERTASRLTDSRFAPFLDLDADGLLLGSVFHDVLFYATGDGSRRLTSLADKLHGSDGQDTFTLIRMQVRHAAQAKEPSLPITLLVGMVSHLFADVVMHPMVWHFSGDYYSEDTQTRTMSRQRHRAMESLMDMVACPEKLGRARYNLRILIRRHSARMAQSLPLATLAQTAHMGVDEMHSGLDHAWRTYSTLQMLFPIPLLARSFYALRRYLPKNIAEIAPLFYAPQLLDQAKLLQGDINYTHPVTRENMTATLSDLMDNAASLAERFCRQLEPALFDSQPLKQSQIGPSLDSGIPHTPTSSIVHFADPPFPNLD